MKNNSSFINIIYNANDFKYIAFKCIETGKNHIGSKIYGTQFAVNGLFAIELYLKSLMSLDNNKVIPKKHDLSLLFDNLSVLRKKQLEKLLPNIKTYLTNYSKGYEEWRYSFSYNSLSIDIEQTKKCLNLLETYCNNIIRELEDYDKNKFN